MSKDIHSINIPWNNTFGWVKELERVEHKYSDDETKCTANVVSALARGIVHASTPNADVCDLYLQTLLSAVASYAYTKGYADAAKLAAEVIRL